MLRSVSQFIPHVRVPHSTICEKGSESRAFDLLSAEGEDVLFFAIRRLFLEEHRNPLIQTVVHEVAMKVFVGDTTVLEDGTVDGEQSPAVCIIFGKSKTVVSLSSS